MTLSIIDPGIYKVMVPWWFFYVHSAVPGSSFGDIDTSKLTDFSDKAPVFDNDHAIYTKPVTDGATLDTVGDNTAGLQDPLVVEPTLSFTYSSGYTTTHETSKGLTVGITQSFDYEFMGVGGSTTLSASGSFNWTDGSSDNHTTSTSLGGTYPFNVPAHKVYEQVVIFHQEQVKVPYSLLVHIDGDVSYTWYNPRGYRELTTETGEILHYVGEGAGNGGGSAGPIPPYKDVNWTGFDGDFNGHGTYALHGSLAIMGRAEQSDNLTDITMYDITKAHSQDVQAEYDPAIPIGVHRFMDDAGREFRDTPFADIVDGGAGDDRIRFNGGRETAHAGAGDDTITALGVGRSLLDGGDGDDVIRMTATEAYGTVLGGGGDDRIIVDAPAAMLFGGDGDDHYTVAGANAGGTVITDTAGQNQLRIDNGGVALGFERVPHSDALYILLGGGGTYDRTRDVVWDGFFGNPRNTVNGADAAAIADSFVVPPPPPRVLPIGDDTLVLHLSEDAWQGDAQFTVALDGRQLGGVQSVTASHAAGASQDFAFAGTFGAGPHTLAMTFINDAWGGTPATDRNLFLDSLDFNGQHQAVDAALWWNETVSVVVPPVPAMTGETLVLRLSEDAWQGDAQFTVTVDGQQRGGVQSVTASHAAGTGQAFTFSGLEAGIHTVEIAFVNDAWGGSSDADRNLYVDAVSYGGQAEAAGQAVLYWNASTIFQVGALV